jgi:hypothetical protein
MHNHHNAAITKFHFGKLFSEAWNKGATVGNAIKGFECTGMLPLKPSAISDDKFLLSQYFKQDSTDSLSPDTLTKSPVSSSETPKPSRSSFLQSTSYLSVAGPSRTTQEKTETVKKNALSTDSHTRKEANLEETSKAARDKTPDFGPKF